jgi:hypothetical protein
MSRWRVELDGEKFDLEDLPELLTGDEVRVVEDGDAYYLEAAAFENLDDSAAVYEAAGKLVGLVNGTGKLHRRSFHDAAAGRIVELAEDGTIRKHVHLGAATVTGRSKMGASALLVNGEAPEEPAPGTSESDVRMRSALGAPERARALELWGGPHDPMNLWKLWEILRNRPELPIDTDNRRRFKSALNAPEIAGDDARHEIHAQPEADTMTRAEAETFLGDLLKRWLSGTSP